MAVCGGAVIIGFQKRNGLAVPFSDDDEAAYSEFKENQVTLFEVKTKGTTKQRSWEQLKLFGAALRVVVTNTEDQNWNTLDKAKLSLKIELNFVDQNAIVYNERTRQVVVKYRSFGYDGLRHMEACNVFNRSWPILAKVIGVTEETLIEMAKTKQYDKGLR